MMNEKLLQNYQHEVLELFKIHYKKMTAKELNLEFRDVAKFTLSELGINTFTESDVSFLESWFNNIHHQFFLIDLINDNFNEIIFHSHLQAQRITGVSRETLEIMNISAEDFQLSFEIFALKNNITWNFSDPFASFSTNIKNAELRATLIHHSTSANRKSKIFLRSIQKNNPKLSLFNESAEVHNLLVNLMKEKKNILVSGSTGSGKTTFMRAMLSEIESSEHVVVLEDTHEIRTFSPNQTSLLSSPDLSKKSLKGEVKMTSIGYHEGFL